MYEIIGVRKVSYFNKKTQRQVDGTAVFVTYEADDISGYGCKEFFISARLGFPHEEFVLGRRITPYFDEHKRVQHVIFQ